MLRIENSQLYPKKKKSPNFSWYSEKSHPAKKTAYFNCTKNNTKTSNENTTNSRIIIHTYSHKTIIQVGFN